jgi:hypothetical protein
MDYDRFRPIPDGSNDSKKNTFTEPPVKDYSSFVTPSADGEQPAKPKKRHHGLRTTLLLIILIVLIAGGYAAYHKQNHKTVATKATTTQTKATTVAAAPKIATTSYDSPNFNVTMNYPTGWTVASDTASSLTVESPSMSLTAASGQTIKGKVVMTITPKGQLPAAFGSSAATAVVDSQLVTYSQPTSTQRAQTYLSFVQYASTTTSGALDGIYITGDYGYQKDQDIPTTDVTSLDPLVTITFGKCADTACSSLTTTNITASSWNSTTFSAPVLTLLKSLAFS